MQQVESLYSRQALLPCDASSDVGAQVAAYALRPGLMRTLRPRDLGTLFWSCGTMQIRPQQGRFCLQAASVALQKVHELDTRVSLQRQAQQQKQ